MASWPDVLRRSASAMSRRAAQWAPPRLPHGAASMAFYKLSGEDDVKRFAKAFMSRNGTMSDTEQKPL